MCMQCLATAATVGTAATGLRAWLAARRPRWLTPRLLRLATGVLLVAGVLASGLRV
jgi:hypothetical protein